MGLDVYLKRYEDFEKTTALEREASEYSKAQWAGKKYDDYTEEEQREISNRIEAWYEERGLSKWGDDNSVTSVELPSTIDPNHMFKIGYFRSSYNSGGINSVLREQLGSDLYDIFPHGRDEYQFQPNWFESKSRAESLLREWRVKLATEPSVSVKCCRYNELGGIPDECDVDSPEKVLEIYQNEYRGFQERALKKSHHFKLDYGPFDVFLTTSKKGNPLSVQIRDECEARSAYIDLWRGQSFDDDNLLFDPPMKVRAVISGVRPCSDVEKAILGVSKIPCGYLVVDKGESEVPDGLDSDDFSLCCHYSNKSGEFILGEPMQVVGIVQGLNKRYFVDESLPCQYLIVKSNHKYEWYQTALEIVVETCAWVLRQPDAEKYYFHWSA